MGRLTSAERFLDRLRSRITEEDLADQLANVIRGESVTTHYNVGKDGREVPARVTRSRTVEDQAKGLVLADRFGLLDLGKDKDQVQALDSRDLYLQYSGPIDTRIIAREVPDGERSER